MRHLFQPFLLAACGALALASCSFQSKSKPLPPQVPIISPDPEKILPDTPLPASPEPDSKSIALTFRVDPKQSVGTIDTTLDPAGVTLGPRRGRCQCPLRGTISAKLIEQANGQRFLHITEVSLATTTAAHLHYEWSILLGDIRSTIPAGKLTITDHRLAGPVPLDSNNHFHGLRNKFTVKCPSNIRGEGLVLKKAVGTRNTNLDIPVTDDVVVHGSCLRDGNQMKLRIPAAVLRDHYDMGEATLDLVFTGDIVATCPAPQP